MKTLTKLTFLLFVTSICQTSCKKDGDDAQPNEEDPAAHYELKITLTHLDIPGQNGPPIPGESGPVIPAQSEPLFWCF